MRRSPIALLALISLVACGPPEAPRDVAISASASNALVAEPPRKPFVISVVGTNDLHGRVFALPLLAGYLQNLRRARELSGGGVLLVDGGDMYQGTLESNLLEGRPVRDAYTALGYHAVTIGNHEFDFGPEGPNATPRRGPRDDPRGALVALASGAPYPFLAANVVDKNTRANVDWKNVRPSAMVEVAKTKVGLVGVTTEETMKTTIAPNVADLATIDLAKAIEAEATSLRSAGARVVVVLAHAGGKCESFHDDVKADKCEPDAEIFRVARALPKGLVDVIVAGHTHAGLAHTVNDIAIIESFSYGRAFGRVDLTLDAAQTVAAKQLFAPRDLCPDGAKADLETCTPGDYEGKSVQRSAEVEKAIAPAVINAKGKRGERLGTKLAEVIKRAYDDESALGNLFADLLREAAPKVDAAFMNGGGLRADLPAGELSYGALFESFPFDNRIATAKLAVKDLKALLAAHIGRSGGILSLSGISLRAECGPQGLTVELFDQKGKALKDERVLDILGSDFMFLGGDAFWGDLTAPQIEISDELMRDALERGLKKRKALQSSDVFDPKKLRFKLKGKRPLSCR